MATTVLFLQVFLTGRNAQLREKTLTAVRKFSFILPNTGEERGWFVAVAMTAGVCEEILYRGFLLRYLTNGPWHKALWVATLLSCIAFGIGHGYQGISGIIATGIVGALMTIIFVVSGALWIPIIFHALIDLRIVFLLQPGDLTPVPGEP